MPLEVPEPPAEEEPVDELAEELFEAPDVLEGLLPEGELSLEPAVAGVLLLSLDDELLSPEEPLDSEPPAVLAPALP